MRRETKRPAKKRFGQHFLERAWIAKVVRAIEPLPSDLFLEIGPGRGALTDPLAAAAAHVTAFEIDRELAANLAIGARAEGSRVGRHRRPGPVADRLRGPAARRGWTLVPRVAAGHARTRLWPPMGAATGVCAYGAQPGSDPRNPLPATHFVPPERPLTGEVRGHSAVRLLSRPPTGASG